MGIFGRAKAVREGWGELVAMLPLWMEPEVLSDSGETYTFAKTTPEDGVLVVREAGGRWRMSITHYEIASGFHSPGRQGVQHGEYIGQRSTPIVEIARAIYRQCDKDLEEFVHRRRSAEFNRDVAWARQKLKSIRASDWV